ncbi:MAG: DUF748 domain-containing protein, partial [Desulfobacterales bacterium]|nr:DUF748 domain-containing protein [Desulfobacterales bacterium]
VAGAADQDGRETELSCDINDIDIPLYFDYLPVTLPVDITQGKANGKLLISFSPGEEKGSKLNIQFTLATTNLGLVSRNNKLSLAIPSAKFEGSFEPFGRSLVFQNILLREPALVGEEKISNETIVNLVPLALRPSPDDPLHQVIPSVFIKLLITDSGSVTIKNPQTDKPLGIWHSIQLSVKDFSNTARSPRDPKSSFRLSGEHLSSSAFFTWQGNFDNQNRPGGNLQLNNIPASYVAPFFGRNDKDVSGIADITGLLSISLAAKGNKPFDYVLKSTILTIKDLTLKDQGVEWLAAPSMRCEPVSQIKGVTDLGNVFLHNSSLTINKAKLPYFFERYSRRPTTHILHGLDFSGTIAITAKGSKKPLINFSNVSFQANRLEQQQQQENNFAFSALVDGKGDVKTKGSLHIAPLQISAQVAFSALSPKQLFNWFTDSQILLSSQAEFSGQGVFRYPQKEYRGDLLAKNVIIHRGDLLAKNVIAGDLKKPAMQAATVASNDFYWSKSAENLTIKQLVVDQPEFSWQRIAQEQNPANSVSIFLRHLFLPEPGSKAEDPDIPLSRFSVKIDSIDFTDGALSYLDKRISPPLGLGITGINGTLSKLNYPVTKDDTLISLSGNIEGAPFSLEGSGKLLQLPTSARTLFTAPSLPLELFSEQIRKYLREIKLTESTASISATTNLSEESSEFKSEVTINKIIPEQTGTITALALALTTDLRGGKTLRVESTETQQIKPVISELISDYSRLLVKAGINPMLLAGEDFKDLVNNQSISFLSGKATMNGESIETLNRYNDFLAAHPLVKLKVIGYADKLNDTQVLLAELAQKEKSRVEDENKRRSIDWKKKLETERTEAFQKEIDQGKPIEEIDIPVTKPSTFIPETPRKVSVSNQMLEDLAASREQVVIDYLVKQLDIAVNRVVRQKTSGSRIQNDGKHTRVDFVLSDMYGEQPQT